jgi:uncharacterized protein (TIRG00374 family)
MKSIYFLVFKVFFSLSLLLVVSLRVDFMRLRELIRSAEVQYLLYAFLVFAVMQFLSVLRWKTLLASNNLDISVKRLAHIQLVGLFFRYLLPTSIGEEVVKIAKVTKTSGNLSAVTISALCARGIGIMVMLGVASVSMLFAYQVLSTHEIRVILGGLLGAAIVAAGVMYSPRFFADLLRKLSTIFRGTTVFSKCITIYDSMKHFHFASRSLGLAAGISLGIFLASALATYSITRGFHLDISLEYLLAFLPLISLVTLFPLTFNGVGIREGAFIYFFSRLGASSTEVLLLPLTEYLLIAIFGLIGGIGYLLENLVVAREAATTTHAEGSSRSQQHNTICHDQPRLSR